MWPGPECYFTVCAGAHHEREVTGEYELINTNSYPLLETHINPCAMLRLVLVACQSLGKGNQKVPCCPGSYDLKSQVDKPGNL